MGQKRKPVLDDSRYNCILYKEKSVHKIIQDILDIHYKQKDLKKRGMEKLPSFTEIALNNLPSYLKHKPSEWLAFVEMYLEKRRKAKKLIQQEKDAKNEIRNKKQIVNNKPNNIGIQCTMQFG